MPAAATECMRRGTRTMPSTSEYSVCTRRWTNGGVPVASVRSMPGFYRCEAAAVQAAGADARQFPEVPRGRIALVLGEAIVRVDGGRMRHPGVAGDLGEDRRRTDLADHGVAPHDRLESAIEAEQRPRRTAIPVHLDALRPYREALEGTPHREERRLQDVEHVYFRRVNPA